MRQLALLHFRNTIVLSVKLDDALSRPRARVPPSVTQMLLILQVAHAALPIVHVIICKRTDKQKLRSASRTISSVQILKVISKKSDAYYSAILGCFYLSHFNQQCWRGGAGKHVRFVVDVLFIYLFHGNCVT